MGRVFSETFCTFVGIIHFRPMKKYRKYLAPQADWSALVTLELVCDSFDGDNQNYNQEDFVW